MQNKVSPDLRRNQDDKVLFGVASGLADYFGVDVAITRAVLVISAVLSFGATLIGYLVVAIIVPERPKSSVSDPKSSLPHRTESDEQLVAKRRQMSGWSVIGLGVLLLAASMGWFGWLSFGRFVPVLLILLGIGLLAGMFQRRQNDS